MRVALRAVALLPLLIAGLVGLAGTPAQAQQVAATIDSTASLVHYTGTAPLHSWRGTSRSVQGKFVLRPRRPDSSRAVIRIPVASFDSGNSTRDSGMRDVTEADAYPFVTFRGTDFSPLTWGRGASGYRGGWAVSGELTFHGRTHPLRDTVSVEVAGDTVRARAEFDVSLTRFDVERPGFMGFTVGDTIRIDARLAGPIAPDTLASR
ncbi:polyisoprenoid-binding protein YceI [Salinibacter ruber]|uniref:YceI family protein n=1 Tax=Salinibacter ruber TaxID=146919 RepID=UPI002168295B|nr:YceI family protein [Salinibacter ruber]MCS3649054.1 polyisoprenoid-binding protein YceI [Salinibacter ruber]MCS3652309.1 polyisoprenoid-binding protein YceI [Salinibacter ruber]